MSLPFADWLARVLETGESVQAAPPDPPHDGRAVTLLRAAFDTRLLDVGGPPLPFDADVAVTAALTLAEACWRLVGELPSGLPPADRLDRPRSAAAHLSADLTLRMLPAVYRRAKARGADDPLAHWAEAVFRRWPLSGVLAAPAGGPDASPDFHGHPGLQLLYAERLAAHPHPAWVPAAGSAREQVERVFARTGKPVPFVPTPPESAA